jgi:putative ABC transport system substrate-binding protein
MDRRTILAGAAASAVGMLLVQGVAYARRNGKIHRVGVLVNGGTNVDGKPNPQFEGLRKALTQLGYVEGSNVVYEARFPEG